MVVAAPRRSWRWLVWSAAALALVIATALVVLKMKPRAVVRNVRHLTITLPAASPVGPLTGLEALAVSPDGKRLVYLSGSKLYLRDLEKQTAEPLAGTEGAEVPFFSPDGRWIGFSTTANVMKKVSLEGGAPVTICPAQRIRGVTWGPDDTIIFGGPGSPLKRVSASGGTPEVVFKTTQNVRWPVFLPGGKNLLYTSAPDFKGNYEQAEIVVRSLETGQSHTVVKGGVYPRYAAGHLLYFNSGTLFAAPFDLRTLRTTGTPKPILESVERFPQAGLAFYDVSTDGTIFYLPHDPGIEQQELLWVDRSGRTFPLTSQRRFYFAARLSPDGRSILASIADRNRHTDLWIYEIAREAWTRVTSEADNWDPLWSPDGTRFVFSSNRNGPFNIFLMASDLATPAKQITKGNWAFASDWSPDGKLLAITDQTPATGSDIWFLSLDPSIPLKPFVVTPAQEKAAAFSPDGRWVAYGSDASGQPEVYVLSADGRGRKWMVSNDGGGEPRWSSNGKELFYSKGEEIMSVDVKTSPKFEAGKPRLLFKGLFTLCSVTRDGTRFLVIRHEPVVPRTQLNVAEGLLGSGS